MKWTEAGVCCDKCDHWLHATCQGINNDKYEKLMDDESDWMCNNCKPPTPKHPQRKRSLKIGTLNCRGLRSEIKGEAKRQDIAEDMSSYDLDILALQETHMTSDEPETICTIDGKKRYTLYHSFTVSDPSNSHTSHGTAIAVKEGANASFTAISDRLCSLRVKIDNNYTATIINAYAPTLPISEDKPEIRQEFYLDLDSITRKVSYRDLLYIAGDFNAKTGDAWRKYNQNMGRYGKGETNSNGVELL